MSQTLAQLIKGVSLASAPAGSLTVDSSGRLLVGTSTSDSTRPTNLQIVSTTGLGASELLSRYTADDGGSTIFFHKSRGSSIGTNTIVNNGDYIGTLQFAAADGTNYIKTAEISAVIDGTPGANDMPGRLVFSTTADGASSPTERMRITNDGYLRVSNDGTYQTGNRHEIRQTALGDGLFLTCTNASYANYCVSVNTTRAANTAFRYFDASSAAFGDTEYNLRGDGNAFADGTWTGGGADYAEYFEWADSNQDAEDRRGISVILDGDKIREAVAGEDPIGVISGNPSVVGDAAWNKWSGKYLRDEYGSYLLDENGDRQLNPAYDPDAEYIPREQRPEWDCVGLMGKLRIRKGQVTGSRWIKMRDISDSVEEWLVR